MADATLADLLSPYMLLNYDASDAASLFEDTGGTNPAEDGDAILCWKPQADSALASVNLTHSVGPTYAANYSATGYAGLTFNGTTQYLGVASPGIVPFTRLFMIVVFGYPGSGTTSVVHIGTGTTHNVRLRTSTAAVGSQTVGGSGTIAHSLTPASATKLVMASLFSDAQNRSDDLAASMGTVASNIISGSLADQLYVGCRNAADQFFNGVLHQVVIGAGNFEWGQVVRATKLLRTKWGLTDPNPTPQKSAGMTNPFTSVFGRV